MVANFPIARAEEILFKNQNKTLYLPVHMPSSMKRGL
jgi:hypothetical protein